MLDEGPGRGKILTQRAPLDPGEARGAQKTRFAQGRQRAQRREPQEHSQEWLCHRFGDEQ